MSGRPATSVQELYGNPVGDEAVEAALSQSLGPRSSELLYDYVAGLGVGPDDYVLDAGCRDLKHGLELVRRLGCRVLGVDPVPVHLERARRLIDDAGAGDRARAALGVIEDLPCKNECFDFIWCRDVLNHVPDLEGALVECARVLRRGGAMLVYQTFATELLEPREAAWLFAALATVDRNMAPSWLERCAVQAGLVVEQCERIRSEWREYLEESNQPFTSRQLLFIARMRRDAERLRRELGDIAYEAELANCTWGVYQMLGKLEPRIYVLRRPGQPDSRGDDQ